MANNNYESFGPAVKDYSSFGETVQEVPKAQVVDMPKESFYSRALSNFVNPKTRPLTPGLIQFGMSAFGVPEEEAYTPVGAILGGFLGSKFGRPNIGAGFGASGGELLKQFARKNLRGEGEIDPAQAALVGGATAAGGKALETVFKGIGISSKLIPEQARAKFFNKSLQAVEVGRKTLSRNWNRSVSALAESNPDLRINLSGTMKEILNKVKGVDESIIPQIKTALNRNPKLASLVDDPSSAINLTLKESQEIKNAITSTTKPIINRAAKGMTTPAERGVFDVLDSIDDKIVEQFPQMHNVKMAYRQGKQAYEMARPLLEPGKAVESSIFSKPQGLFGLGGTKFMGSTQGKLAFKKIASITDVGRKAYDAALLAHGLNATADFVGRIGQVTVGASLVKKLGFNQKEK